MGDYISREDAIMVAGDMLNSLTGISCKDGENTAREYFRSIPSTDIRENVKAHWIDMTPTGDSRFMCSRCKWKEKVPTIMGEPIVWDYCPSCGAQMER